MTRESALRDREFKRILLIKLSAVGDVIHTLPVLTRLRERYPDAQIDWVITPACEDLVRWHPALDGVISYPRREAFGAKGLKMLRQIMGGRYDLVVDMHGQLRTAALVLASGAPVRIGFSRTREGAKYSYTHHIPVPSMDFHAADRNLWLGDLLGFPTDHPDFTIHTPPEAELEADRTLARIGYAGQPFAAMFPGTQWETKHWPVEGFVDVCRYLTRRGMKILLAGAGRDQIANDAVARAFPEATDICGQTSLAGLAAILRRSSLCVTNDSGPMHMAVALGRPLVSAFGPTSPVRTGPYARPEAVVRTGVACSPCYIRKTRNCPYGLRCLTELSSEMMINRIDQVLATHSVGPEPTAPGLGLKQSTASAT